MSNTIKPKLSKKYPAGKINPTLPGWYMTTGTKGYSGDDTARYFDGTLWGFGSWICKMSIVSDGVAVPWSRALPDAGNPRADQCGFKWWGLAEDPAKSKPAADQPLKEFLLDCKLFASIRVKAESLEEAESSLMRQIDGAPCNAGSWPNGDPIIFEASLGRELELIEIDGEPV